MLSWGEHVALRVHDDALGTHDADLKDQDAAFSGHDAALRIQDAATRCHDATLRSQDVALRDQDAHEGITDLTLSGTVGIPEKWRNGTPYYREYPETGPRYGRSGGKTSQTQLRPSRAIPNKTQPVQSKVGHATA